MAIARRDRLALRRQMLIMRSAVLRERLRQRAEVMVTPLALADRAIDGFGWLRSHPLLPAGLLGLWIALRPRRAWRLAWRGWVLWRGARSVMRRLDRLG